MRLFKIYGFILLGFLFTNCIPQKNIPLPGTTWVSTNSSGNNLIMVSFIDDKVAYIIDNEELITQMLDKFLEVFGNGVDFTLNELLYYERFGRTRDQEYDWNIDWNAIGFAKYDNINVGTRTVSGKNDDGDWSFTYNIENDILTLNLPDRLNPQKQGTQFSKRLVGNNNGQPIGIWTNNSSDFFYFTNSEIVKRWTIGTYVSWDYISDDEYITWSGNKDGGKFPYKINKDTEQIRITLPGDVAPTTLTLVSNKFVIIF